MSRSPLLGELVTIPSASRRLLDGIIYRSHAAATTVIHIHGSYGNFYHGGLVQVMGRTYFKNKFNYLSINTTSHDGVGEGYFETDAFEYIGGGMSDFNECVPDIAGAVAYAHTFSDRVILQGHSLGCDRVLHYLLSVNQDLEFVLLSPCDSYRLQQNWLEGETVEEQIARLKRPGPRDPHFDWLSSSEYGVKGGKDWTYRLPITRKAFLSIAEGPPYRLTKISSPAEFNLTQPNLIAIGGADALQVWPHKVMFDYYKGRIKNSENVYLPKADHMFAGYEDELAQIISAWIHARGS